MKWALNVPWPRRKVTAEEIEAALDEIHEGSRFADAALDEIEQPRWEPAVNWINVDGDGNLYVFPNLEHEGDCAPVDVYDPSGAILMTGCSDLAGWLVARGEHVYSLVRGNDEEPVFRRYRLQTPF